MLNKLCDIELAYRSKKQMQATDQMNRLSINFELSRRATAM